MIDDIIKKYKYAIFDCDGVILHSNEIKTKAFRESLSDQPTELVDKFIDYHIKTGGVSRYDKLGHYFTFINPKNGTDFINSVHYYCDKYAKLVEDCLLTVPLVKGIEDFLIQLNQIGIKCFVNSGGDEVELNKVFKKRNLDQYFVKILGSPGNKITNMFNIMHTINGLDNYKANYLDVIPNTVFFGDSEIDYICASKFNCDFVFVSEHSEWDEGYNFCKERNIKIINNFDELI